jgi:hypothetical protein
MKVEIFTFCDAATVDLSGNLNILGASDNLHVLQSPIVLPSCALAFRCRFERIEEGTKLFRLSFIDSNGTPIIRALERQTQIHIAPDFLTTTFQMIVIMVRTKLPSFGEYSIDLAVDGRHEASIPLYVRQKLNVPPTQPPTPTTESHPQITARDFNPFGTAGAQKLPAGPQARA